MTRLPHVDSARRFFRDATTGLHRPSRLPPAAVTIAFGLAFSCSPALAQNAAKGSLDHIKAVTSAVDSASIKETAAKFAMSEGAVRVALHRGLASLAAKLKGT